MTLPAALFFLFVVATMAQIAVWQFLFGRLTRYRAGRYGLLPPFSTVRHNKTQNSIPRPRDKTQSRGLGTKLNPEASGQNSKLKTAPPPVSVIICARNEADNLRAFLPAILEQQYPDFEVIVVDDDSADDTQTVLAALQRQYAHLRVLRLSPKTAPGKKRALEQGIRAARHEYLVFTDADCTPAGPGWLRGIAAPSPSPPPRGRGACSHFTHPPQFGMPKVDRDQAPLPLGGGDGGGATITLGYAPYLPAPGLLNRWIRFETNYTAMLYFSFALAGWPYMGVGRNLAWHKSLFEKTGGFSSHAHIPSGDDDLFVNAAAYKRNTAICLAPESFMYSAAKKTWAEWLRQKRRHLAAGKAYRPGHQMALAALTLTLVLHYFLLSCLLFTDFGTVSVAFYAIRMVLASGIYWNIRRLFRDKQSLIWFPLLDALLATYYAVLVPLILIRSNYLISWK